MLRTTMFRRTVAVGCVAWPLVVVPAIGAVCGDGVVGGTETCDPPGSMTSAESVCRADCTHCGDGVLQSSSGESCDDGNPVSGCNGKQPEVPLDGCLRSCQRPLCGDPSRVLEFDEALTGRKDAISIHGRLFSPTELDFDQQPFEIEIFHRACSDDDSAACEADTDCSVGATCVTRLVLRHTIAGGVPDGHPPRWRYRSVRAKEQGGIYTIKLHAKKMHQPRCAGGAGDRERCDINHRCPVGGACLGYYVISLQAYADTNQATSDMQTRITAAGHRWTARGLWTRTSNGWWFGKRHTRLEPSP